MAPRDSGERVYRSKLGDFHHYLQQTVAANQATLTQLAAVQTGLLDVFKEVMTGWQERFAYCYPRLGAQRRTVPPAFVALIDRVEAEENARLEGEIADLNAQVRNGRARMDQLISQGQDQTLLLRRANPKLNEKEEALKARQVKLQDEFATLYEQIEALDTFPLGWLTHAPRIAKLKGRQRAIKKEQQKTLMKLRLVRKEWDDDVKKAGDVQATLRQEWQEISVKVSQAQTRSDHLSAHLTALAEQDGLRRVLEELDADPGVEGELGDGLRDLIARNRVRRSYEQALAALGEAVGLTRGVGQGTSKFAQSVGSVVAEQRRHSLKEVQVQLSEFEVGLNQTWEELGARVKDAEHLAAHPDELTAIVQELIKERFTDESIQALFERMGKALNRATTAWK
jgi:hypothetical protein